MGTYITGDGFVAYSLPARSNVGTALTKSRTVRTYPAEITIKPLARPILVIIRGRGPICGKPCGNIEKQRPILVPSALAAPLPTTVFHLPCRCDLIHALYAQTRSSQPPIAKNRRSSCRDRVVLRPCNRFHEVQTHPENHNHPGPRTWQSQGVRRVVNRRIQSSANPTITLLRASALSRASPAGAPYCTRLASIWLTDAEEAEYRRGERAFSVLQHGDVHVT
jgi:hypothetical protein